MRRYDVTDGDLLQQVARGDEAALRELFDRHAAWLQLRLQRRTSDPDLVADALQDTFVAVWRSAASYRGDGDVGGWLWGIAIRRLISRLRARRGDAPLGAEVIEHVSPAVQSAEDQLLVGVEYGDLGRRPAQPLPRAAHRRPGDRHRRAHHQGGGPPARPAARHRQDPASGPRRPSCAAGSSPERRTAMMTPPRSTQLARRTRPARASTPPAGSTRSAQAAVETHVERCAACRADAATLVSPGQRSPRSGTGCWSRSAPPSPAARPGCSGGLRVPEVDVVVLRASGNLVVALAVAVAAALVFALVAAQLSHDRQQLAWLADRAAAAGAAGRGRLRLDRPDPRAGRRRRRTASCAWPCSARSSRSSAPSRWWC